jgi:alkylhydroperoxidase family enzyme
MRALLAIADAVRADARNVTPALVDAARAAGADDETIHDAVLVAAAFCMFNRYVDGLRAITPDDPDAYAAMGKRLAEQGYLGPTR